MTIKEALARKMLEVWYGSPIKWRHIPEHDKQAFLRVADECIKQMEWMRHLTDSRWMGMRPQIPELVDISLYPDNWKHIDKDFK